MKILNCNKCNKEFERRTGEYNQAIRRGYRRFYCSNECRKTHCKKITKINISCTNCDTIFQRRPRDIEKSNTGRFFCSRSCAATYNNKLNPKRIARHRICPECLNKFKGQNKYCSAECIPKKSKEEYKSDHRNNVSNLRKRMKEKAISLMGGECQICKYNKCSRALHFHHINPEEKDFNISLASSWEKAKSELDKCVLLCANCHAEVHDGLIDI